MANVTAVLGRAPAEASEVVNTTSIDHLSELRQLLGKHSQHIHVWMINLARGTDQLDRLSFEPVKPSFLLAVTKA